MSKKINCYLIELSNEKAISAYNKVISKINSENPYYSFEIINDSSEVCKLKCFILTLNEEPLIALPFNINPIEINSELMPYFDVSSPYGFNGPLYGASVSDELLTIFWQELDKWYLKNSVISEFIRFDLNYNYRCYNGNLVPSLLNVKGSLLEKNKLWDNFKPKVRNNVRRAQKEGLECIIYYKNITSEIISIFHEIYLSTMTRNKAEKRYFFDLIYFQSLIEKNINKCAIAIVYTDKTPISAELLLISTNTIYSHLGGTNAKYFSSRPNDFLKFQVMLWGIDNKKKFYVLGGGRINRDGLYDYKKSYFPKDQDVIYYTGRKIVQEKIYYELLEKQCPKIIEKEINTNNYFPKYRHKN